MARPMLVWIVMIIITALVLGVLDYLLHLPSWVRLASGLMVIAALMLWIVLQLRQAMGLKIDLTALALRAERLYPQLSGVLASGVEFAFGQADAHASARTQAMTRRSIEQANSQLAGVQLTKLIDPTPTLRIGAAMLAAVVVLSAVSVVWPTHVWLGVQRWFTPFADVQWPKRTAVQSLMTQEYWPSDTPLRLRARVTKGHYAGMRLWAAHRVIDEQGHAGPWQSQLMSDQSAASQNVISDNTDTAKSASAIDAGTTGNASKPVDASHEPGNFERVIDALSAGSNSAPAVNSRRAAAIEFQFSSSDDQTAFQRVALIDRPALVGMTAQLAPPAYAQGLVAPQTIDLHAATGQIVTARALAGSTITLTLTFNKPLPAQKLTLAHLFPAFDTAMLIQTHTADASGTAVDSADNMATSNATDDATSKTVVTKNTTSSYTATFKMVGALQSSLALVDGYGLTSLSQRAYRFEPVADALPSVSVTQPGADESVLATAVMDLTANMQDDIGSSLLTLELSQNDKTNKTGQTSQPGAAADPAAIDTNATGTDTATATPDATTLARTTGRAPALHVTHTLDLALLKLTPGDELSLWATGQDIYEDQGKRHDPVKSPVRTITIIDPAALSARLVQELASVRQQAVRLEAQQQSLVDDNAKLSAAQMKAQQAQLSQRIAMQQQAVNQLTQRQERNRLDDPELAKLLSQSAEHLKEANEASQAAAGKLQKAQESQQQAQQAAAESKAASEAAKAASENNDASAQEKAALEAKAQQAAQAAQAAAKAAQAQQAQAKSDQEKTSKALADLVELLSQGQDAMALVMQLQQLAKRQEELSQKTRDMLPKTLGKTPEQLTDEEKKALAQMAQQQAAMQQQAQELIQKMQAAARSMSKPQSSPRQQAAAQALSQAAQTAQQQGLNQSMEQSAKATEQNQLSSAAAQQAQAESTMQQMLEQMNNQQAMQQEILKRQMEKLAAAVRKLIEQQKQQITAVDQAGKTNTLDQLDAPALTLRRNTAAVHEQMRASEELKKPAIEVEQSVDAQAQAVSSMRVSDAPKAKTAQQQSLAHLETALRLLEAKKDQEKKRQEEEKRAELRKKYEALAQQQNELAQKTQVLVMADELDRRQRAQAAALGQQETALRDEARTLGQEVKDLVVFEHLHRRIDQQAGNAADALRRASALSRALTQQQTVERTLLQLASALKEPPSDPQEFSKGNGGGGGGGEGAGGEKPLVPPLAELRLLRDVQQALYEQTRAFDATKGQLTSPQEINEQIIDLSGRQRELAALGDKLIEQLKAQQGPGPAPGQPPESE